MNERIRKLVKQAKKETESLYAKLTRQEFEDAYNQKFAELIVQECLNMCANNDTALQRIRNRETPTDIKYVRYGAADYEYAAAYGKQIDHYESIANKATCAGDKIREHFGVEE